MSEPGKPARALVGAASKPVLPRHIKLRHDTVRDCWTILAPERVFSPDPIALAVLQLCDGHRTVDHIAQELTRSYGAPKPQILSDIVDMLQDLVDKGVVVEA
jgi:pyrroloquinoline quinone biosynthesis protein D